MSRYTGLASRGVLLGVVVAALMVSPGAAADDWPTYHRDNARSGVAESGLEFPLAAVWEYRAMHAPRPAWPAPAKQDFWHKLRHLRATVTYDRAYHTAIAGGLIFFGSSVDDTVYALDAATGEPRWSFTTQGPVRLAPAVHDGRVYLGSDDGWAYCLDAATGAFIWKARPDAPDHRIPGNGRMISWLPVRTGVLVEGTTAYFCAGLFPGEAVYRCAVDARTGAMIWSFSEDTVSPQGYLLASPTRLFVPTGRTTPAVFDRDTGELLGTFPGQGGAFALLVGETLFSGPGRASGELTQSDADSLERVVGFDGYQVVVRGDWSYLLGRRELAALDRVRHTELARELNLFEARLKEAVDALKAVTDKTGPEGERLRASINELGNTVADLKTRMDACYAWRTPHTHPFNLILAGDTLIAGGDGEVAAFSADDGRQVWSAKVRGRAYGLAAAGGALFVSTDAGAIHCFRPGTVERERVLAVEPEPLLSDGGAWGRSCAAAAEIAVAELPATRVGYALVLGGRDGRLAQELIDTTELNIVIAEDDPAVAASLRARFRRAGLYGVRVAVHDTPLDALPYASYLFNLVVSERALATGKPATPVDEVYRVLRPYGGVACIGVASAPHEGDLARHAAELRRWMTGRADGAIRRKAGAWAVLRRGAVPGAGEWTQLYADAAHTACSGDALTGPMTVQWFGEPGPRDIIDRHHRPMSSLFKDGRLFVPADDKVIALDAYNGTLLWELDAPNSRRIGALKNCGHMLLTEDALYVAVEDVCWGVNPETGERTLQLDAPKPEGLDGRRDWGYLNRKDEILFGSGQRAGASFSRLDWETCDLLEGDFRPVIVSEYLFAVGRRDGAPQWIYDNGVVMNNAVTLCGDRLCFAVSRNEKSRANADGRMRIDDFCADGVFIVAIDARTGALLWEAPFVFPFEHIMFLNSAPDTLLFSGTYNEDGKLYYGLYAFDPADGRLRWETRYQGLDIRGTGPSPLDGTHGEQWQHPVISGDIIYSRPFAFDLATGAKRDFIAYRGGHGCGGWTGSANYLYGRGHNPRMYPTDVPETEGIQLTRATRPGCWLNIIPAGGLVMIPESSSGCTCGYPLQTSLALAPRAVSGLAR